MGRSEKALKDAHFCSSFMNGQKTRYFVVQFFFGMKLDSVRLPIREVTVRKTYLMIWVMKS